MEVKMKIGSITVHPSITEERVLEAAERETLSEPASEI
jgi:hypothetical protein